MSCREIVIGVSVLCCSSVAGEAVTYEIQETNANAVTAVGQQAVTVVLDHYILDPLALVAGSGKPLPGNGRWSVGKKAPDICPKTADTCVEVFYSVAGEDVNCAWTVLLSGDGTDGQFLDENADAARYLLRRITDREAGALVEAHKKPLYPPIAIAAHVQGQVTIGTSVSPSGTVEKTVVLNGPEMLRFASIDAAKDWKFKPFLVGSRAVPYQIRLNFTYRTQGPSSGSSVSVSP